MMKAYEVRFENEGVMVFAETPGMAKSKARNELSYADWIELTARRLPSGDKYIGQKITDKILFENGFYFECCGEFLDSDWEIDHNQKVQFDVDGKLICPHKAVTIEVKK
jgi:hypothetical protein